MDGYINNTAYKNNHMFGRPHKTSYIYRLTKPLITKTSYPPISLVGEYSSS